MDRLEKRTSHHPHPQSTLISLEFSIFPLKFFRMKTVSILFMLLVTQLGFSQAYTGQGDIKFQIGANIQNNGTGIMGSLDFGLGENISLGVASTYLLGIDKITNEEGNEEPFAQFEDRFDIRTRFNANLGNVINVDENFDVYPGLYAS